ncbi:MAG TPA: VTT domain-containing protein [Vicinamibacteria bacterium]|nr:VTT domain-containing protein [Vicinamibacteria bacterium]
MENVAETLDGLARDLGSLTGGLGLFVIAFFDSSLLSLPEINDVLLVYFGTRFPELAYYYALMMVLGSASGGSLLFWLARYKGHRMLERRFAEKKIARVFGVFGRYGALAVVLPAVMPPPFPFKIFVLSAGVLGLPYQRFLAAIALGRSVRYFGEAFLAVRYGERAMGYLEAHGASLLVLIVLVLAILVLGASFYLSR